MADENTEIARGLRRRDPDLLDHLIEKYQYRLLRYLLYLTGRREMAEDFFQETWIRALERGSQYDGRHEFSTWPHNSNSVRHRSWQRLHEPHERHELTRPTHRTVGALQSVSPNCVSIAP